MYNSSDGTSRSRQHLQDGSVVTSKESGSMEGDNGEIPSSERTIVKKTGDDPALTLMARTFGEGWQRRFGEDFGKGLLGTPTEADKSDDPFNGFDGVEEFFKSQEGTSFLGLLAKVLLLLAKSSGQGAAQERELKMMQLMNSLAENLEAAKSLADGARGALTAGIVSGMVGLVGAGVGMGANFYASRLRGQAGKVGKQMKELDDAALTDILRADLPGGDGTNAAQTAQSAAEMLSVQKERMVTQMQDLEARAAKVTGVGEGVGRVSGSAAGMGSSASTMVLMTAQAEQATRNAVGSQESQAFNIEDEWQRNLTSLKDTILSVISEAVRAMAQANSAAFK
ncbi:hypothetical protein [Candidatus Ichthyocystis hellenicum]|uniref:hypothetical protein n=1 Tax=Candidatus Ichthyocystis hellenicum TaxID=1561003 RepID=UPI000B81604B|nr:hypothetical protein [Candidatus Ichthyocystis hellenicum]